MNRVIKLLMLSDIFVLTGFGLIDPILAIFIKDSLVGGTIFAAGLASALFLITKSAVQLPFSKYVDKNDNSRVRWLIFGLFLIAFVPLIYMFARDINAIYFAQVLHGIGAGFAFPTWLSLWSTNLDRRQEGFEWSLYSTLTSFGTAITAALGAAIAQFIGFTYTFLLVAVLSLIGCAILIGLERQRIRTKTHDIYHYVKKP